MRKTKEIEIKKFGKIEDVSISKIESNPYQTREKIEGDSLLILAKSIRERGLFNPITVLKKNGGYIVINGHRRLAAFKKLRKKTIPAFVKNRHRDKELIIDLIHENLIREDLNPIEKAHSIRLLISTIKETKGDSEIIISLINSVKLWKGRGFPKRRRGVMRKFKDEDTFRCMELLKSIGISENCAVDYLSILKLPRYMQSKVQFRADKRQLSSSGRMNVEKAYQLSRVQDIEYKEFLFQKAITKTSTKIIQSLVDNHIEKVNRGEWKGIEKTKGSIWKSTKSDDRILEISNDCNNLSAKLNSWKITKLIQIAEFWSKELFFASMNGLRKDIRLLDEAIVRKLKQKDKKYKEMKNKENTFEARISHSEKKHNFRISIPAKIAYGLDLKKGSYIQIKIKKLRNGLKGGVENGN